VVLPGESNHVCLLRHLRNRSQPLCLRARWSRVVSLVMQVDLTAGPRLTPLRRARRAL
jgi:hypothetical protein